MTENTSPSGQSPSRRDFERDVIMRAQKDAGFRRQLLADPRAALKAAYGLELPPEIDLHVVEESPSKFFLVLPPQTAELTDEQLASVAGGVGVAVAYGKLDAVTMGGATSVATAQPDLYKW